MRLQSIICQLKNKTAAFNGDDFNDFLAVQITLSDISEVFYVEIKNGKLSIEPYEYHDRQAHLIISSEDFIAMISGQFHYVLAFTTGKLKVEGDLGKAAQLAELFESL